MPLKIIKIGSVVNLADGSRWRCRSDFIAEHGKDSVWMLHYKKHWTKDIKPFIIRSEADAATVCEMFPSIYRSKSNKPVR